VKLVEITLRKKIPKVFEFFVVGKLTKFVRKKNDHYNEK
jgi:hypothetical protein